MCVMGQGSVLHLIGSRMALPLVDSAVDTFLLRSLNPPKDGASDRKGVRY